MPWPLNPVALPMEERGAKGLFMAIMDTGIKKNPPASYTPRAPSTAPTATHFQRKHNIYDNVITICDAIVPRTNSPQEEAESASELSNERVNLQGNVPARKKTKRRLTEKMYLV